MSSTEGEDALKRPAADHAGPNNGESDNIPGDAPTRQIRGFRVGSAFCEDPRI